MRSQRPYRRGSIWDVHNQTFADLGRVFREAFGEHFSIPAREAARDWAPVLDFCEMPESFIIRVDLPGVPRDAVEVTTEDDMLIIRGEKRAPEPRPDATIRRTERQYGRFRRRLTLPAAADVSEISARMHDGVLEVTVAKSKGAKPRRIEISG